MTAVVPGNFWELDGELGAFAVFARGEPASSLRPLSIYFDGPWVEKGLSKGGRL